jgi:Uma2 family endonuclease
MIAPAPRHKHSLADYLAVEEMSAVRHEFLEGEIYAMAGGTPEHAALSAAAVVLLGSQLRGRPCRPYSADLRIRVPATGLATYADATIVCGEPERDRDSPTHVTNPTVIVEVLSPSTEDYDRGEKREHYQRVESLREYVLVAQSRPRIEVFSRTETGDWSVKVFGPGDVVDLGSVSCTFAVDELYRMAGIDRAGS